MLTCGRCCRQWDSEAGFLAFAVSPWDSDPAAIRFHTKTSGSHSTANERMTIAGNGNVGIGSTTPQAALDVVGDLHVSGKIMLGGKDITSYFSCEWDLFAESGTSTNVNAGWWDSQCAKIGNPMLSTNCLLYTSPSPRDS